jgi:SSS family solute:Na+ symporter
VIPFIIVFPGIIAFQLYGAEIANGDQAYPILISRLLPAGLRGVLFAALFGAVMSSLDSMLNSASTIYTMDVVKRWWRPDASPGELVRTGRVTTAVLVVLACLLAPLPGRFEGVFQYVQLVWGFISPGVVTVFLVGLLAPRVPAVAATAALLLGVPTYGGLLWALPEVAFLNHMAITAALLTLVMAVVTSVTPRSTPWRLQAIGDADGGVVDTTPDPIARGVGAVVVAATIGLYVVFW